MIAGGRGSRLPAAVGLHAAAAAYVLFALLPLYWTLKISVTPGSLLYAEGITSWPSATTLENYARVLGASDFPRYFLNSVLVSVTTAVLVTLVAAAAGYALSRFRFRGKAGLVSLLLLTQTFPLVMVIPPIYRLMGQLGLTDNLLGLQILTLTLPGIGATLGFVFTAAWSELLFALMLINSEGQKTFAVGLLTFIGKFAVDWGQMMAASILALVPAVLFFGFLQRYLVAGLTAGAVKG